MADDRVSFSLDGALAAGRAIFEYMTVMARPLGEFIHTVTTHGWLGVSLTFAIFFTLFLIRMGARSAKGIHVYSEAMEYVGLRGLAACAALLALLVVEWLSMPPLTIFLGAVVNSFTGEQPGISQTTNFLMTPSASRTDFLGDVAKFYGEDHSALPLGFNAAGLVATAFGSMFLVGKASARWRAAPPPPPPPG